MGPPPLYQSSRRALSLVVLLIALSLPGLESAGTRSGGEGGSQQQQQQSSSQQQAVDFDCPEEFGYYAHPSDCTLYYVCVFGGALLESCTGGLMYSHELQTCDWPRNVGCGLAGSGGDQEEVVLRQQQQQQQQQQPKVVQQQQQFHQAELSARQRQRTHQLQIPKADLYTEEEELGAAEELESDRQQRVYRGQPSTIGQVASDRDGLSTHTNAIPVAPTGGRDKLSVVSYGAQQQYNRASVQPSQQQVYDARGYNTTRYIQQQQYDPNYYAIYDDDQYKDVDYTQYVHGKQQDTYRKKPSVEIIQQQDPAGQRGYTKNKYSEQEELYQSVTPQEYDSYSIQTNDDLPYRFPEVTESGEEGKRRLITLSAKFSHEGRVQTNRETEDRQKDRGASKGIVDIRGRKEEDRRASPSAATPSIAEQINSLLQGGARGGGGSEEQSDEAVVRRGKPLTVEEVQVDLLAKHNSKSSHGSLSGALAKPPFTSTDQSQPSTQENNILSHYRIGSNLQTTSTPLTKSAAEEGYSRQAKLIQEITTPRQLFFQIPVGSLPDEKVTQHYRSQKDESNIRLRGSSRHQEQEHESRLPEQLPSRKEEWTPTQSPLRITVQPFTDVQLKEHILKQYNVNLENVRAKAAEEWKASNRDSPVTSKDTGPRQIGIKLPTSEQEAQRERVVPYNDFVNSKVKALMDAANRNEEPASSEEERSASVEEQASEEARKPVAVRVPDSHQRGIDDRRHYTDQRQSGKQQDDHFRKPIRYIDSLEYKERNRVGGRRGSSRYSSSSEGDYDSDELTNVTEEPQARRPVSIRIPDRVEGVYQGRAGTGRGQEASGSRQENSPSEEERRRVSPRPVTRTSEAEELSAYRYREESATEEAPLRTRSRAPDDSSGLTDNRSRVRAPSYQEEDVPSDHQLRFRYEVATTLRPTRVLNFPTASKPTRPPKKFRNGTIYSDLTLPLGTDLTDTEAPQPDPSTRVRPVSYNVPTTPGLTRGSLRHRGSQTYTVSPNEAEPPSQPRGTPPPQRGRPTLKPSTTVVGKASEFQDIYRYPPNRPENIYPTPQVDKTAAKCRKDVCLLPDCYCGGKDVPGELSPEQTPQIVLLTFDDSVNDLNKGLYSDLFEKGRTNPNGCPISATFYVSHEWTDYSQVQNLYAAGHEIASHSVSHSFGEQFSQRKWTREIAGQREILAAYGGVRLEDIRGMRAPFLSVGGNKMFKMLYDSNFTYDSSMPVYENRPPSWPYTLDYKIFHDCMIPPCPTKSYPGVWEVPMVMWQDLNGGRCSMGDACSNPPTAEGVYKMLIKNFERHFTTNRAPFGLFYHAAWFTQPHHKEGFIAFLDTINKMPEVWLITNWQAIQWVRDPTPLSRLSSFAPFQCNYPERPKKCNNPKVCNLWHKSGVRYMRTCQACPEVYPWTGKSGVRNSRVDNDLD